jgi:hypothetical protein
MAVAILVYLIPREAFVDYLYLLAYGSAVLVPTAVFVFAVFREQALGLLPLATLGVSLASGSIMSSGLGELSVVASLSLSLAVVAKLVSNSFLSFVVGATALVVLMGFAIDAKYKSPFSWWGLESSHAKTEPHALDSGLAKGLFVDSETLARETDIASHLDSVASCDGAHVSFPHVPRFHLDREFISDSRLAVYWFDFSSEEEVLTEINRLDSANFCSLLVLDPPPFVWEGHEMLFGKSRLINHRALRGLLELKSLDMEKAYSESLANGWVLSLYLTRTR